MAFSARRVLLGRRTPGPPHPPQRAALGSFSSKKVQSTKPWRRARVAMAVDGASWRGTDVQTPIGRSRFGRVSRCIRFTRKWLLARAIRHRFRLFRQERPEDRKWRTRHIKRLNRCTSKSSFRNNDSCNKYRERPVCRRQGKRSRSLRAGSNHRRHVCGRSRPRV
jgi:hypothetical protein